MNKEVIYISKLNQRGVLLHSSKEGKCIIKTQDGKYKKAYLKELTKVQ